MAMRGRAAAERLVHRAILDLLRYKLPRDAVVHHSPNELDMHGIEAATQVAKARSLGTRKGWPDLEILWDGRAFFLEVKSTTGRLSQEQAETAEALMSAGCRWALVRSVTDAEAELRKWGMIR